MTTCRSAFVWKTNRTSCIRPAIQTCRKSADFRPVVLRYARPGRDASSSTLNSTASLLPERPPRVGELVEVRSRRWLVEAVEDVASPASPRVSLACADDDAQGQALEVYWDFEIDRRILEQEAWSAIGARGFDPPRFFTAFLHTLRWNCVTATDPNLFQSPFRAGIRIDAYQMEPLRKALRLPRVQGDRI